MEEKKQNEESRFQDEIDSSDPSVPDFLPPPPDLEQLNDACGPDLTAGLATAPVVESQMPSDINEEENDGCLVTPL